MAEPRWSGDIRGVGGGRQSAATLDESEDGLRAEGGQPTLGTDQEDSRYEGGVLPRRANGRVLDPPQAPEGEGELPYHYWPAV